MAKKKITDGLAEKKKRLYDRLKISIKTLDIIIYIIVAILLIILIYGLISKLA